MTPLQLRDSITAQANAIATQIATAAGLSGLTSDVLPAGEYQASLLLDPRVRFICNAVVGDPDPNVPGT